MNKRNRRDISGGAGNGGIRKSDFQSMSSGKAKIWEEEQDAGGGGGVDELLAVLGYKVKCSEMNDVADKLEQLEMVMGAAPNLLCDTVHYNPSDLSRWLQSMLSELNNPPNTLHYRMLQSHHIDDPLHVRAESSSVTTNPQQQQFETTQSARIYDDDSEYDLRAIPGSAAYPQTQDGELNRKRLKTSGGSNSAPPLLPSSSPIVGVAAAGTVSEPTRSIVLVDSHETGVQLVHTLMACAEAVQQDNLKLADALVKRVELLAASQAGAMGKVATYFAEALARRIYKIYPQDCLDASSSDILQMHFYETCPYLKFAHFTANQAILEAFATASKVHVIDFGLKQGMQWPALIQALALRPGGPPAFRLTGIGPPQADNMDALQQVGWKLAQLAEAIGVEFQFRGFVANSLADIDPSMVDVRPDEAVAVNSVFELHPMLARPGAIDKVLSSIKSMKPKIFTIVEQEANHNGPFFVERFNEALHYYSSLFDSLEGSGLVPPTQDLLMSEVYLGEQICNVVASDGADRVERHETLTQWRARMGMAGFEPVHLGSNAFRQASMLLALFAGGNGYRVEENNGCLMLGWHTRPLIATSAWQLIVSDSP
ncbi:hypothetical protein I3842_04G047000 [Carya illinoinensis]|uniref:DELLA protein n=1 Tax=Carya illinoinensis TaxID=32201 RepID=A0A922F9G3_CARIL|nr:hypothetical protein I3842_04G047000 [Carya illinoinensis]